MEIGKRYDLTDEILHSKNKNKKEKNEKNLISKIKNVAGKIASNSDAVTSFLTGIYFSKCVGSLFGGKPFDANDGIILVASAAYSIVTPIFGERTKVARSLRKVRNAGAFLTAIGYEIIRDLVDNIKSGPTSGYVCDHPPGYHDGEDNLFQGFIGTISGFGGLGMYILGESARINEKKISQLENTVKEEGK